MFATILKCGNNLSYFHVVWYSSIQKRLVTYISVDFFIFKDLNCVNNIHFSHPTQEHGLRICIYCISKEFLVFIMHRNVPCKWWSHLNKTNIKFLHNNLFIINFCIFFFFQKIVWYFFIIIPIENLIYFIPGLFGIIFAIQILYFRILYCSRVSFVSLTCFCTFYIPSHFY